MDFKKKFGNRLIPLFSLSLELLRGLNDVLEHGRRRRRKRRRRRWHHDRREEEEEEEEEEEVKAGALNFKNNTTTEEEEEEEEEVKEGKERDGVRGLSRGRMSSSDCLGDGR